ncbi:MAG TPA: hypothetical protein VGD04_10930 [Methylophilus sp.]
MSLTEYHFKAINEKGEVGDVAVEVADSYAAALKKVQKFYPKVNFQLINKFCLDCDI